MTAEVLRIGRRLFVERPAAGELRFRVSEWAGAPWLAVPLALGGVPLAVWSAVEGHAIELGGALVACWFAGLAAWLWQRGCRDVRVRRDGDRLTVSASSGAGPFRRHEERTLDGDAQFELRPAPRPPDAPASPDPGADLLLVCGEVSLHVVRLFGPASRRLEAARASLREALDEPAS